MHFTPADQAVTGSVVASSRDPVTGLRLDSVRIKYPRLVHADVMTHRAFSRNASSSRAVPTATFLVRDEPYIPRFRKNQPGMRPGAYLSEAEQFVAAARWLGAAEACRELAGALAAKDGLYVHKEHANRPLEWFGYIEVLITSTQWSNFDALRDHEDAQQEAQMIAQLVRSLRAGAKPRDLRAGEWHLPFVGGADEEAVARAVRDGRLGDNALTVLQTLEDTSLAFETLVRQLLIATSAARACRISYLKLDGSPPELEDDMRRYLQLAQSRPLHASPLEHQARRLLPGDAPRLQGNLEGFAQFRKFLPRECL